MPERALRARTSATTSTRCGSSSISSATGAGLNLTEQVRDGIARHSSRAPPAADARGADRAGDRPRGLHQPRHRRRGAGGAAARGGAARASRSRCWGTAARRGSTRSCTTWSSTPSGRGTSCRGREAGPAMGELREFMFERVYLGPAVRAEHAKIAAVLRRLFEHYVRAPRAAAASAAGRRRALGEEELAQRGHRLPGGDDRPVLHPGVHRAPGAAGVRPLALPPWRSTRASPRTACATRSTSSSWSRRAPSCAARARRATRACARSTTSARRRSGSTRRRRSTTASAARPRATCSRSCRRPRGVDFKGALELLAERYGVELQREEEDPREAERRKRRERLLELLTRTAPTTSATCGSPRRPSARGSTCRSGAWGRRSCGSSASATRRARGTGCCWPRAAAASQSRSCTTTGLAQRSQAERAALRPLPLADHVPACRHPRAGARLRRAGDARGPAAEVPEHLRQRVYHKGLHLYGADLARAHAARAGEVILCEGYTDVIALHQAGMRNAVGLMGTALTGEQVGELARMAQTVLLALDADSAGQEAMLRASTLAAKRKLELRVVPLPAGADPAELIQREGPEAMQRARRAGRCRSCASASSGCWQAAMTRARRGATACIEELRPVFATLPPSAMRMELTRMVSGRLALPESLAETLLAAGGSGGARGVRLDARVRPGAPGARRAMSGQASPAGGAPDGADAPRGHRAGVPGAVHRLARGGRARRWRASSWTSTSRASCCVARPSSCARETCASRWPTRPGDDAALEEDPQLKGLLAELVVEAGGRADRRCSRCSACSSSSPASNARSSGRGARGRRRQRAGHRAGGGQARVRPGLRRVLEETGSGVGLERR